MGYADSYKKLSGLVSRHESLPKAPRKPDPIPAPRKSALPEEYLRLAGLRAPQHGIPVAPTHAAPSAFSIKEYMREDAAVDEAATRAQKFAAKARTRGFNKMMKNVQKEAGKWKKSVAAELRKLRIDPKKVDQSLASNLMLTLANPLDSAKQLAATVGKRHEVAESGGDHVVAIDQEFMDFYGDSGGWENWLPAEEQRLETHLDSFRNLAGLAPASGLPHLASDGDRPRSKLNHSNNLFDEAEEADKELVGAVLKLLPKKSRYSSHKFVDGQHQYWFDLSTVYSDWKWSKQVKDSDEAHAKYFGPLLKKIKSKLPQGASAVVRGTSVVVVTGG